MQRATAHKLPDSGASWVSRAGRWLARRARGRAAYLAAVITPELRARIEGLLSGSPVLLFMKGSRREPACGFSARVVDLLDDLEADYVTVDILADAELREGLKEHSSWPSYPQLYVAGKLIGGHDILTEMARAGELAPLLGVPPRSEAPEIPEVHITESAVAAFLRFADTPKPTVRLSIDRAFAPELEIEDPRPGDVAIDMGQIVLAMDRASARRAHGVTIEFVEGRTGSGFRIENPNEPPKVKSLPVGELARWRKEGKPLLLLDVRTDEEREIAVLPESVQFGPGKADVLEDVDRATTLVLYCHHGVRSRSAAEHCIRLGFRDVWNLTGGIDAWSKEIDPLVRRY